MAQKHDVEITIDKHGKIQFIVKGIKGTGCSAIAKAIQDATKFKVTHQKSTGEAYEAETHCSVNIHTKS